ncbi:MAG: response regulator [Arcobacter sp.]|nr:MAG: response regulator [Arcobacter sp.]
MDKRYKIAIVDDENEILNMLRGFLSRNPNYDVVTYSNPLIAISSINNDGNYDVVLMDIMMPQMNGLDALEQIVEKNPEQKVVMMTAYSTLDTVLKSQKYGAIQYLMKPFGSLQEVQKKIDEVLNHR